jgi:hypothetical protein
LLSEEKPSVNLLWKELRLLSVSVSVSGFPGHENQFRFCIYDEGGNDAFDCTVQISVYNALRIQVFRKFEK